MSTMFIRILGLFLLVLSMSSCRAITEPYHFTRRLAEANDEAASAQREFRETG